MSDLEFYARDYVSVNKTAADFDRVVEKYKIGAFLLTRYDVTPTHGPLIYRILLSRPDWKPVYADEVAMVFLRKTPENLLSLERCALYQQSIP